MPRFRNLAAGLIGASVLASASAAEAHPRVVSTTPGSGAVVSRPTNVQLRFSEKLVGPMTGADVLMTGMPGIPRHNPVKMTGFSANLAADGKTLNLVRNAPLPAGRYTVAWHAVSVDTHRVAGRFMFAVK